MDLVARGGGDRGGSQRYQPESHAIPGGVTYVSLGLLAGAGGSG